MKFHHYHNNSHDDGTPLPFYAMIVAISHLWMIYYFPDYPSPMSFISFTLQQMAILSILFYIDLKSGKTLRFIVGGTAFFYSIQVLVYAISLTVMGITATESFAILMRCNLREDFAFQLHEAGFSIKMFTGIMILLGNIFVIGGVIRKFMVTVHLPERFKSVILPSFALSMTLLFILEQTWSRNDAGYFSRREMPALIELYSQNGGSFTVPVPPPADEPAVKKNLDSLGRAGNPGNILFIVLESFRYDMLDKTICPNLYELSKSSLTFDKSYCDGIYTSLSWNVLFIGHPPYTLRRDMDTAAAHTEGSTFLRILKKEGYTAHLITSANFEWNLFYDRFSGKGKLLDGCYSSYKEFTDIPRNGLDNMTAEKVVTLIYLKSKTARPFAAFVQLDSSHFTYFYDHETQLYQDYPRTFGLKDIRDIRSKRSIGYLFFRYKNAVHHVDLKIGEIIQALKETGQYDDTAIVIVSDHGEGFAPGSIGHHVYHDEIKRMFLLMRLPGVAPQKIESPVTHKDIVPSLLDYLRIPGLNPALFIGKSFLHHRAAGKAILTLHGSELSAELNCFDKFVYFRTDVKADSITFTPYRMIDAQGTLLDMNAQKGLCDWEKIIAGIIRGPLLKSK